MAVPLRMFRFLWKSSHFWVFMTISLVLSGCTSSDELVPPTAKPGSSLTPSPTPILPAVYDLSEIMDAEGVLTEEIDLASADGRAVLHLDKGTRVVDEAGKPVQTVTITTRPAKAEIEYSVLSSPTFEVSPRGTMLDPPGQLTIRYDAPPNFTGMDPEDPQVGASCGELEVDWEILDTQAKIESLTAMADVDRLGLFIVVFLVKIIS